MELFWNKVIQFKIFCFSFAVVDLASISEANTVPEVNPVSAVYSAPTTSFAPSADDSIADDSALKTEMPINVSVSSGVDIYNRIVEAIADKTGYPADMIDGDMELEAGRYHLCRG